MSGILRGYDQFMNLTIEEAVEEPEKNPLGTVVRNIKQYSHEI